MSRTKGYKCYNIQCGSCIGKTLCGEPGDAAPGCDNRIVSKETNGDKIRAMSDKELAHWICSHNTPDFCEQICPVSDICEFGEPELLVDWLRQPAEED